MAHAKVDWYGREVIREIDNSLEEAIKKCVLIVEADAKRMCAVDTGRLRASITNVILKIAEGIYQGRIGSNVEYAPYVALGTSKMPAQPYLRPAIEKNWDRIQRIIRRAV